MPLTDKVYQRPDDIQKNMANMEQQLREMGHVRRKSVNTSALTKYKPAKSSLLTAHAGSRAKATRLIIKQKMGKDDLKKDILPPPPVGKSVGHGLINDYSFAAI